MLEGRLEVSSYIRFSTKIADGFFGGSFGAVVFLLGEPYSCDAMLLLQ